MSVARVLFRPARRPGLTPRVWLPVVGVLWLDAAAAGLWVLWRYDNTPGSAAHAPDAWPDLSALARATDRPTLVMLAHPHCTCTRASLGELARLPVQTLKIDRSFVSGPPNARNVEIVRAILALAAGLSIDVTAEGVETADQ